jgi:[protein-PII] uridylyltransferase
MPLPPPPRSSPPALAEIRETLQRKRAELAALIPSGPDAPVDPEQLGMALARRNAAIFDELLVSLFDGLRSGAIAADPARALPRGAWDDIALAGVGSYGRGLVALKSDLDVRLLARSVDKAAAVADALLYPLWDMGVSIGHQVVTDRRSAARREDRSAPAATSLLDLAASSRARGSRGALRKRSEEGLFAHGELPRFAERLSAEVAQRHERFGGSVYLLEPDVKNGAGGLRDLDVATGPLKARFGFGEPASWCASGSSCRARRPDRRRERDALWRVRNLLHAHAGRRSDRLTFDEQEAMSVLLGYGERAEAIEHMMSAYYRSARTVSRALRHDPVAAHARPHAEEAARGGPRRRRAALRRARHDARQGAAPHRPGARLRLVEAALDRDAPLLPTRATRSRAPAPSPRGAPSCARAPRPCAASSRSSATCQGDAAARGSVMRELHDTGLLLAMIPEFSPVVGRTHHDTYHVYTVDVHSVAAVDRLATLVRGELAQEFPLACRLAAEITRPEMLFFATLLHDVGKAIGGSDHSRARRRDGRRSSSRASACPPEDVERGVRTSSASTS